MGVDQPRQHRAVAHVHEPRTSGGGHRPARRDPGNAVPFDEDVDVALYAAAAVEDSCGAEDRARGVLSRQSRSNGKESEEEGSASAL